MYKLLDELTESVELYNAIFEAEGDKPALEIMDSIRSEDFTVTAELRRGAPGVFYLNISLCPNQKEPVGILSRLTGRNLKA